MSRRPPDTSALPDDGTVSRDGLVLLALLVAASALFAIWPQLDLLVSARLYTPERGFVWRDAPWVRALYIWTPPAGHALLTGLLLTAVFGAPSVLRRLPDALRAPVARWATPLRRRTAILALCAAVLGPGLLIEGTLKPCWQRPRPVQVQDFGGAQPFVPALRYCGTCERNHSFVSSHAAAGFALMYLGLGAPAPRRRRWLLIGLAAGSVVGLGRMLQGGHFLSDIVFAFIAVWLSAQVVLWLDRLRARRAPLAPDSHRPHLPRS